ncbi:sensor histidine kinase [Mycolicibacterium parafortuitum]|nr:HAMP domain-containing sensor histidine kinase [Mycolicibacterium parafortuitum]ORB32076.1 ATP-binding protein [Mycolicibacterium parafortuitum]
MTPTDTVLDGYGLARVVVAVRFAVVVSIAVLVAFGPDWLSAHAAGTAAVLVAALLYAVVLMTRPRYEVRRTRFAWLVSVFDAAFTLALIALTGGASSPVASVLALVVIASAARLPLRECLLLSGLVGAGYVVIVLTVGSTGTVLTPWAIGLWWALYVVFIALLSGGLSRLLEHEHQSHVRALVEAEAEHAAAEEERDLRARLLRSYEAQQEGLKVLLHEFRTPVASLDALTAAAPDNEATTELIRRHARHLSDMLDALSDVSLSRRPAFSTGRVRTVDLADLITEAADAAGIEPARLRVVVTGATAAIRLDAQGLRRVLTNLLENAARHGRGLPIEVDCTRTADLLSVSVLDRGPGVPQDEIGAITGKFVSLSDRRGTAGLGLWIVAQIVDALGGTLAFSARDGGGLAASFTVPVA